MLVNEAFPQRRGRGASLSVSEIAQHLAGDAVANFARAAVFAEFGRHARALDQANFVDRMPGDPAHSSPDARLAV